MPTIRPRYQITETDEVAEALDRAAARWPDEPRSKLLLHLIRTASGVLEEQADDMARDRAAALDATAGSYGDAFGDEYLERLREDWPE